jgi:hypothetical protein
MMDEGPHPREISSAMAAEELSIYTKLVLEERRCSKT